MCARIGADFCGECVDELRNTYLSLGTHFCVFMISERNFGPARWTSFTLKKVPGPVWSSYDKLDFGCEFAAESVGHLCVTTLSLHQIVNTR